MPMTTLGSVLLLVLWLMVIGVRITPELVCRLVNIQTTPILIMLQDTVSINAQMALLPILQQKDV